MRAPVLLAAFALVAVAAAAFLWPWSGSDGGPVEPDAPAVVPAATPTGGSGQPGRVAVATGGRADIDPYVGLVRVLCRDVQDAPLAGCRVKVGEADTRLSGDDGAAEVLLAPGRQWLEVQPADATHLPVRQRVTAVGGQMTEVVVVLPGRSVPDLWCRVVAAETGKAIAGVHLLPQPSADAEVVTGDDGLVCVKLDASAEYVRVAASGRSLCRVPVEPGHATAEQALEVRLGPSAELRLVVVDRDDRPVGGADVSTTVMPWSLAWPKGARVGGGPELLGTRCDEEGLGTLREVPAECPLFVTVTPPPGTAAAATLQWQLAPGVNEKRVVLEPLGAIRGRVVDAGDRPVGGARVAAMQAPVGAAPSLLPVGLATESVLSDADGSFELPELQPGQWLLGLTETEGWTAKCQRIDVPAGAAAPAVVRAVAALSIQGRLLGPDKAPISAFEVHALSGGRIVGTGITEKDGSYVIQPLPPGEYEIFTELYQSELAMVAPVHASAGRTDVDVHVASVLGTVRGRVVGAARGDLWLRGLRRDGAEFCGGRCDIDGRFEQPRLRSGTWDLSVTDSRGNVGVLHGVTVVAGATTAALEVTMRPGAVLRPVHPEADQFRIENGADVVARDALERGLPGEAHVPPGTWSVVFLRAGFELARREVTVAAGAEQLVPGS